MERSAAAMYVRTPMYATTGTIGTILLPMSFLLLSRTRLTMRLTRGGRLRRRFYSSPGLCGRRQAQPLKRAG